jgi:hypothetical protein
MHRLKIRLAASVLIAILAPLWLAESKGDEPSALGTSEPSSARSPITETCLDQDKLPCTMETLYLLDADGSNATKIVVAYPFTERRTNAQNVSYFPAPHFTLPANDAIQTGNGLAAVPMGSSILLPKGSMGLGPARLVSVEKLKPTIPVPPPRRLGPPAITITEPKEGATRCPLIQLKGLSDQPLRSVRFDLINTSRQILDHQGFVTDSYFDLALWKQTTNYFQCFDINLTPGTNTIVLRCEDLMGWVTSNTLIYELRLDQDKTPPRISIRWPTRGRQVSGTFFTVRGQVDDFTTRIAGRISGDGRTVPVTGVIERGGRFWLEHIPLLGWTNLLTITAVDAVGHSTVTNIPIIRSQSALTIDPVPLDQLWQLQVTVTGAVNPPNQRVWLNGRPATVQPDGRWSIAGVALNQEGVAILEATAIPAAQAESPLFVDVGNSSATVLPQESVSVQAGLGSKSIIVNVSQPTYGTFSLHLTGTEGRSFVISASTNLLDWLPILTNSNSTPSFEYADTNIMAYGCRFYRVAPVQ